MAIFFIILISLILSIVVIPVIEIKTMELVCKQERGKQWKEYY